MNRPGEETAEPGASDPALTPYVPDEDARRRWSLGYGDPVIFAEQMLGVKLHNGQRRWLRRSNRRENLLATGNRWGKSFVSAVKLLHRAIYRFRGKNPGASDRYRSVTASISQDQANIIFDQVVRFVHGSSWLPRLVRSIVRTPFPTIVFGNGAVLEARSTQNRGEYLLGHDYDVFVFDEVAFETDPECVVEEVVMMRLADREGQLDLVSTPNGRNWFHRRAEEIRSGKRPGYFQSGDSRDNPHISPDYLAERVAYFSERRVAQNIMGRFVDSGGEILRGDHIDAALRGAGDPPPESARYLTGWDLARKRTATVGITVAVFGDKACVVALERLRHQDWNIIIDRIKLRQRQYPGRLVVDATGLGDVVIEQVREYNPDPVIFTETRKNDLLTNVELFHARGRIFYDRWELPDGPGRVWSFEDELRAARWDDNNECDSLMALGLALWPLRTRSAPAIGPRVGKV